MERAPAFFFGGSPIVRSFDSKSEEVDRLALLPSHDASIFSESNELLISEVILRAAGLSAADRVVLLAEVPTVIAEEARRRLLAAEAAMPETFLAEPTGLAAQALEHNRLASGGYESAPGREPSRPPARLGPYRVDGPLGAGGMGEVYRGFDSRLDRPVALKRILTGSAIGEATRARFRREARAAARLSHSAIVQVHDWIEGDQADWLVMELVEGRPLADLLESDCLEPKRAMWRCD